MNRIVSVELPEKVHGFVTKTDEYVIYINSNDPLSERFKTLLHENAHIVLEHFESSKSYYIIEQEAKQYVDVMSAVLLLANNYIYNVWDRHHETISGDCMMRWAAIISLG